MKTLMVLSVLAMVAIDEVAALPAVLTGFLVALIEDRRARG